MPRFQDQLNRCMPVAADVKLGDVLADLITQSNRQSTAIANVVSKHNGLAAKLDADGGVTDTNYVSLQGATAFTAATVTDLETRAGTTA